MNKYNPKVVSTTSYKIDYYNLTELLVLLHSFVKTLTWQLADYQLPFLLPKIKIRSGKIRNGTLK